MPNKAFLKGLELFNRGEYYDCHEEIEAIWLKDASEYRNLYKGVIQAASAIYQFKRDIRGGALRLYRASRNYLLPFKPETVGLDITRLLDDMEIFFKELDEACLTGPATNRTIPKSVVFPSIPAPQIHYKESV